MNIFAKEAVLDHIVLNQLLNRTEFEEGYLENVVKVLEEEVSDVFKRWKRGYHDSNLFGDAGRLYDFVQDIRRRYQEATEKYDGLLIESDIIREILSGVNSMFSHALMTLPNDSSNVIEHEDERVVTKVIHEIKRKVKQTLSYMIKRKSAEQFLQLGSCHITQKLLQEFDEQDRHSIVLLMKENSLRLVDMNKRPELKKYMDVIDVLIRDLKDLQSLQVDIVSEDENNSIELAFLGEVIRLVHEVYENSLKMKEFTQVILEQPQRDIAALMITNLKMAFEEVSGITREESKVLSKGITKYHNRKKALMDQMYVDFHDEMRKAYMFEMRKIKNQSKEIGLLSCQIIEAMKQAKLDLRGLDLSEISNDSDELLNRIIESIEIKFESLKEENFEYTLYKRELWVLQNKQLLDFNSNFLRHFEENFERMLVESTKHILQTQELFNRLTQRFEEQCLKADIDYLKRSLLIEIVTFEEIIRHSLPKLQDSEEEPVIQAVGLLLTLNQKINRILVKSGITIIEPGSHDKFNGKEHEIVYAEERQGFNKGEIIQVQTNGYAYRGVPIVRANIIAAK